MGVVNVDYEGAIIYQSTAEPGSCTISLLPTDLSRLNKENNSRFAIRDI